MKKIAATLLLSAIFLFCCWGFGMVLHPEHSEFEHKEGKTDEKDIQWEKVLDGEKWNWSDCNLFFENNVETQENPWGISAGIIDVDMEGKCIFLTPNTSVVFQNIPKEILQNGLTLQFKIHPWVASDSDGAGLLVSFINDEKKIIKQEEVVVNNIDEWQENIIIVDEEVKEIKLLCNSGQNNDETADWVIVK